MPKPADNKPVALSTKIYARLLALYPRDHRREYGGPMTQLFHDQCRDAWAQARGRGLAALWVRVSIDLLKTSVTEHLRNLKQRKSMFNRIFLASRASTTLRTTLLAFVAVTLLLWRGSRVLLAHLAPEQYASTARLTIPSFELHISGAPRKPATEYWEEFIRPILATIQSDQVLGKVVSNLNLDESIPQLRDNISLIPDRRSSAVQIVVFDKSASRAAAIANAVARVSRNYLKNEPEARFWIIGVNDALTRVEEALPGMNVVRPGKPAALFLGIFGGMLMAAVLGAVGVLLVLLNQRLSQSKATAA